MRDRRVRIAAPIGAQEHCRHADVHAVAFIARHPDPGIPTNVDDLIPGGAAEICRSGVAGFSYSNPGYALAGNVYIEVPVLFGGDLDRGEQMFRKGLALAPRFTAMRLGLARTLIKKGRFAEARTELQAVLDEKAPDNIADWTVKDSRRARELLDSIREKS